MKQHIVFLKMHKLFKVNWSTNKHRRSKDYFERLIILSDKNMKMKLKGNEIHFLFILFIISIPLVRIAEQQPYSNSEYLTRFANFWQFCWLCVKIESSRVGGITTGPSLWWTYWHLSLQCGGGGASEIFGRTFWPSAWNITTETSLPDGQGRPLADWTDCFQSGPAPKRALSCAC